VPAKDGAMMLALEQLLGAVISVIGGVVGEKFSAKAMMIVSLVALTIGMAALAYAHGWPLMWVYVVGVGIGFGLSFIGSTVLLYNYFGKGAEPRTLFDHVLHQHVGGVRPALRRLGARHAGKLLGHVPAVCGDLRSDPGRHHIHAAARACRLRMRAPARPPNERRTPQGRPSDLGRHAHHDERARE
jgi:hypothetical protein